MNLLNKSKKEIQDMIDSGFLRKENLRHWEVCRALAAGKTQEAVAEEFNMTDDAHVRYVKKHKCKECR